MIEMGCKDKKYFLMAQYLGVAIGVATGVVIKIINISFCVISQKTNVAKILIFSRENVLIKSYEINYNK